MRPRKLKTKIFLDSSDPAETKKIIKELGFLDGQTTNPSLVAKNPEVRKRVEKGKKFTKKEIYSFYKSVIKEISGLIPDGSVSIEVYADYGTTSKQMLEQAIEMFGWIPNAHIKLPIIKEGLIASNQAIKEKMRVNMTLCFTQEQAEAVALATKGAKRGDVFVSPFIGRLDDVGLNGMSLVSNIIKGYGVDKNNKTEVLAASIRNMSHFLASLSMGSDIITASYSVLSEWGKNDCPIPDESYVYKPELKNISYSSIFRLRKNWRKINIEHKLTRKGIEKFCADWMSLIE